MKKYQEINLEDHPEYTELIDSMIEAETKKLILEGYEGEELDTLIEEYKVRKGI